MADVLPADTPAATPDIESMSDEQFVDFKKTLTDEAPAPEPAPAPADDDDDDEGDPSAPQGTVPHAKFHRANERRKESERRAQEAERASTLAMQRMAELLEASKPREPEPQAQEFDLGPDPEHDPIGALAWQREQKRIELEQRRQWEQQTAQQRLAEYQWQQALGQTAVQFEQAKAVEPQLQELYDGLRQSYAREYAAYGHPVGQIGQLVERQEAQIIQWAHANRVPIAQAIKNLAASRGVQAQASQASTQERDPVTGQFKSAAELDRIEKTKQASKSLGGGGAPVRADVPTAQDIVNMSDEDFAAFKKKHGEKAMRIAMGAS